jgi:hypothetical protein
MDEPAFICAISKCRHWPGGSLFQLYQAFYATFNSVHHFGFMIFFRRFRLMFVPALHFALKMFHLVV